MNKLLNLFGPRVEAGNGPTNTTTNGSLLTFTAQHTELLHDDATPLKQQRNGDKTLGMRWQQISVSLWDSNATTKRTETSEQSLSS